MFDKNKDLTKTKILFETKKGLLFLSGFCFKMFDKKREAFETKNGNKKREPFFVSIFCFKKLNKKSYRQK